MSHGSLTFDPSEAEDATAARAAHDGWRRHNALWTIPWACASLAFVWMRERISQKNGEMKTLMRRLAAQLLGQLS
jgi:hypothetical protein